MLFDPKQLMASVAQAADLRPGYIGAGEHKLALSHYEQKLVDKGPAIFASFVVIESTTHTPKTVVTAMFKLYDKKFIQKELSSMKALVSAISGSASEAEIERYGTAMLEQNAARGVVVNCVGVDFNAGKPDKGAFIVPNFSHEPDQTPESIAQTRTWVDNIDPQRPIVAAAPPALPTLPTAAAAPAAAPVQESLLPTAPAPLILP